MKIKKSKLFILFSGFWAAIAIIFLTASCGGTSGAKLNLSTEEVYAALQKAIETDDQKSFDELIPYVPNMDTLYILYQEAHREDLHFSLLGFACKHKRLKMAEQIIGKGADINIGKEDEVFAYDALWVAVESEDAGLVKLLLSKGADPNNVHTEWGLTVLSKSCSLNNYDIAKLLLGAGAKADGAGDFGFSEYPDYPIVNAVRNNNIKLVQLLIDNNCTVNSNIGDSMGSIFMIAEENKNPEMVALLRKHAKI